jgi:hypothetical protein
MPAKTRFTSGGIMKRWRAMGLGARVYFCGMIGVFVLLAATAGLAGWWFYSLCSVLLGIAFVASAPFVLGRGWRRPQPGPTRRPVVRRRR